MDDDKNQFIADLVVNHGTPLEKYLTRKLDNAEEAAEIAQEAYLRLHRMAQPENLDNARAFLFQVASNLAVDQLRRRNLHIRFIKSEQQLGDTEDLRDVNAGGASPEKILAAREKLAAIYEAVDELPFKVKQAFLLHRRNGMPYSAIAEQMQVSVSSVEKYILQALQHCRKRLEVEYSPRNRE